MLEGEKRGRKVFSTGGAGVTTDPGWKVNAAAVTIWVQQQRQVSPEG